MGRIIPYIMENNKCLKPPTSIPFTCSFMMGQPGNQLHWVSEWRLVEWSSNDHHPGILLSFSAWSRILLHPYEPNKWGGSLCCPSDIPPPLPRTWPPYLLISNPSGKQRWLRIPDQHIFWAFESEHHQTKRGISHCHAWILESIHKSPIIYHHIISNNPIPIPLQSPYGYTNGSKFGTQSDRFVLNME